MSFIDEPTVEDSFDNYSIPTSSLIAENLWQGAYPEPTIDLDFASFDLIVCTAQSPPRYSVAAHQRVIHFGFADGAKLPDEAELEHVADQVNAARLSGKKVLVHCLAGMNRSGLVCGLALIRAGMKPSEAIEQVRKYRSPHALFNPVFVNYLLEVRVEERGQL